RPPGRAPRVRSSCGRTLDRAARVRSLPIYPEYAASRAAMSSFFIWSMAFIARCDFGEVGSPTSLGKTEGTICQDTPYLSLSQPPAVLVLGPAALRGGGTAAGAELVPVVVDLGLRRAVDLERDRLVEREDGTAVERGERLAGQLEGHHHHAARRTAVDLVPGLP